MHVIDFHTHYYPPEVFGDPRQFARKRGESHWQGLVAPSGKATLQGWADEASMLRLMDAAGVERSVLLAWYWENDETAVLQNRWYAELIQKYPDRFSAFAAVPPQNHQLRMEELKFAVENGFKGVGELHPWVQGLELLNDEFAEVFAFTQSNGLMLNLHVTEPVGRAYQPKVQTDFGVIQQLIERYQHQVFILSHLGGLAAFHHLNPYIKEKWGNVFYDLAATPLLYDPSVLSLATKVVGAERILFGSDFPLRCFPKRDKSPNFETMVKWVEKTQLSEEEKSKIFTHNAQKLLGCGN